MIIATDKRDDNLEVDEIISRHVRVASLYSFGIKRHAKQWTSPNSYIFIYFLSVEIFICQFIYFRSLFNFLSSIKSYVDILR